MGYPGVSGNSRSRPFPRMKASDSHSRIMGMDFVIPFPFPNFGNVFFSFSSRSRIMGMFFFFHSLPIPKLWEWLFLTPFPFPNFGNVFFPFPSRSRIWGMELTIPVPECPKVIPARPWIINRAVPKAKTFVMDIAHCDSTVHSLYTNIYSHLCILGETRQDLDVGEEEREAQRGGHGGDI